MSAAGAHVGRRRGAAARALALATLGAVAAPDRAHGDDAPAWLELDAPAHVEGLRCVDVDGDGLRDVLVVAGREVRGWRGVRDGVPTKAPTWTWRVPDAATFVGANPRAGSGQPILLALAGAAVLRLAPGAPAVVEEGLVADVGWADAGKAVLADLVRGRSLLLPTPTGLRWLPDVVGARATAFDLALPRALRLVPAGPFVEDGAEMVASWPCPEIVAPGPAAPAGALLAFAAEHVHALVRGADGRATTVVRGVAPVAASGDRRDVLVDLTGDGVPDLAREATSNEAGVYAFFPVPDLAPSDAPLAARSVIRLKGFQIPTDYVDLDGDGRRDFVVTTIDIDGANVMRALTQGRVTARTRAFMNRGATDPGTLFPTTPDAEVESDIRVRIRFTFSGAIDVQRSFTILATADLDGDGRRDLAIRTPDGHLTVRRGTASGVWAKEPVTVALPAEGDSLDVEGYVTEATGDRRDDLVLLYRAGPGGADRLYLLPSR